MRNVVIVKGIEVGRLQRQRDVMALDEHLDPLVPEIVLPGVGNATSCGEVHANLDLFGSLCHPELLSYQRDLPIAICPFSVFRADHINMVNLFSRAAADWH